MRRAFKNERNTIYTYVYIIIIMYQIIAIFPGIIFTSQYVIRFLGALYLLVSSFFFFLILLSTK